MPTCSCTWNSCSQTIRETDIWTCHCLFHKKLFLSHFEETALNSQDKYTILDSICPGSSEILHRMTKKEEYQRKTAKNN